MPQAGSLQMHEATKTKADKRYSMPILCSYFHSISLSSIKPKLLSPMC